MLRTVVLASSERDGSISSARITFGFFIAPLLAMVAGSAASVSGVRYALPNGCAGGFFCGVESSAANTGLSVGDGKAGPLARVELPCGIEPCRTSDAISFGIGLAGT